MAKVSVRRGVPAGMRGIAAWIVAGLASTSAALALLTGACGASPARSDVAPVTDRTCARPSGCSLAWTEDDVCGCCGRPRRGHVEALSGRAASERMSIGCPACDCPEDPTLFATAHQHPTMKTVAWANGADLAPEFLFDLMQAQQQRAA